MAFATAVEIFQQGLIMRAIRMTMLTVVDISVLLSMADNAGELPVLLF